MMVPLVTLMENVTLMNVNNNRNNNNNNVTDFSNEDNGDSCKRTNKCRTNQQCRLRNGSTTFCMQRF